MITFFKNFGNGVLYVLVLPFLLVGMALYGVVAFFIFLFLAVKGLVLFFTGRSLYEDLPEDKEAKRRLAGIPAKEPESTISVTPEYKEENTTAPTDNQSVDPFYVPEYLKTDEMKEEEPTQEEQPFEEEPKQEIFGEDNGEPTINSQEENYEDDVITVQKNPQNETIIKISDIEDEDDDNGSGINIDYE